MINGIEPTISITEKRISETEKNIFKVHGVECLHEVNEKNRQVLLLSVNPLLLDADCNETKETFSYRRTKNIQVDKKGFTFRVIQHIKK